MATAYSHYLLGLIAVVFLLQVATGLENGVITSSLILEPATFFSEPWRIITSMLLHGSFFHLFFNGFALLMFGPLLEQRIGRKNFIGVFLAAGVIGALLYYATIVIGIIPPLPALGASAGIYGILGALAVLFPELKLFLFGLIPLKMKYAAVLWFFLELFGSFNAYSGIGSAAHLGGLLLGLAAGFYFKKPPTQKYEVQFIE
ncbi:rhomboid family intramembrane serine protease [Candidatus Micrarchaeota archaeon]|nr:rhomboid family intramembrane serine protease [Candidatus Micrarchaeota archaeon]